MGIFGKNDSRPPEPGAAARAAPAPRRLRRAAARPGTPSA